MLWFFSLLKCVWTLNVSSLKHYFKGFSGFTEGALVYQLKYTKCHSANRKSVRSKFLAVIIHSFGQNAKSHPHITSHAAVRHRYINREGFVLTVLTHLDDANRANWVFDSKQHSWNILFTDLIICKIKSDLQRNQH